VTEPILPVSPPPRALTEALPAWVDPLGALAAGRGHRHPVLLLSGLPGHPASRFSILAWDPTVVVTIRGGEATLCWDEESGRAPETRSARDPFDLLRALAPAGAVHRAEGLPFCGGAIGYLGYGLRRSVESLPAAPPDPLGQPDAWFGLYDAAAVFDHLERRVVLVAAGLGTRERDRRESRALGRLAQLRAVLEKAARTPEGYDAPGTPPRRRALVTTPRREYLDRVGRALRYIAAGDIYQVNLSHRIECPHDGDPLALFGHLSRRNPAPFAAYLDAGDFQVISASPERFLRLREGRAVSNPIKGTRPRGGTPAEDERLGRELLASRKDRAENVMIADLVRNDLGRVCVPGSVRVETLCGLESFATVHHLVSTVVGQLRPDRDRIDLLRALFPGGSMTGAPKVRAMEVIDELEGEERGIYSGSIGYLSLDGGMDLSIVIRTIVRAAGRAHLRVGGGIVADSDPGAEHQETLDKARALLEALGATALEGETDF
jgi:para-aminobenzoate synthetase component 1